MKYCIHPALQTAQEIYNEDVFEGLDFLLSEMGKRDMKAVMVLGNFWTWSGGFPQYYGEGRPPRPGKFWKKGDVFLGDPPHELQGWYGMHYVNTFDISYTIAKKINKRSEKLIYKQ
jgi:hypothetical protein